MEKALKQHKIRYRSQFRYGMGIMDFYLPEGNIALFVDAEYGMQILDHTNRSIHYFLIPTLQEKNY